MHKKLIIKSTDTCKKYFVTVHRGYFVMNMCVCVLSFSSFNFMINTIFYIFSVHLANSIFYWLLKLILFGKHNLFLQHLNMQITEST